MDSGIAGSVASTGVVANIPDAYENPQFNQAIDKKSGYRTKAILCMPIKSGDEVIGVIQLINKVKGGGVFSIEDEDIMMIFLAIAGPILAGSNLYAQIQGRGKGANEVANEAVGDVAAHPHKVSAGKTMPKFAEDEEEEEDS